MKRRLILSGIIVSFCLCQATGCWSRKELNNLSLVMAGAIDQGSGPDKFIYTVQIVNPAAIERTADDAGQGGKPYYTASSSGFTLADAERHLYKHVPRPLFWQHMRVTLISEELARNSLSLIVDYLDRIPAFRRKMLLLVTPGKSRDALSVETPVENFSGQAIYNLARESFKHSEAYYPSDINNFLINLSTPGIEPILARLTIKPRKKATPTNNRLNPEETQRSSILELSGSAAFKADKMIGWLDDIETRGLLWTQGKAQNLMLVLKYPGAAKQDYLLTVLNQRSACIVKPEFRNGQLQISLGIKAEGRTSGVNFNEKNFTQPEIIKKLDCQYALAIKREISMALARAQSEFHADIFGFGLAVSRKYPRLWKKLQPDWDRHFSRLKVNLQVTARIRRTGLTLNPTTPE
jgi:spore germination protein KC